MTAEAQTERLVVNALEINWDESGRRTEKPCGKCGKGTRGRWWGTAGPRRPAHMACAIELGMAQAFQVFRDARRKL